MAHHLVYMRVFEGCNLRCKHCFIPANEKKMPLSVIDQVPSFFKQFAEKGDSILIQWHGGEPMSRGSRFFEEAIPKMIHLNNEYTIEHGIQTNLINYNEKWRDIFKKHFNSKIGVSWDHSIRVFANKPNSHKEYDELFFKQLKKAQNDDLSISFVITITKPLIESFKPYELLSFLKSKGMYDVSFEKLTKTGYAIDNWNEIGVTHLEHEQYLSELIRPYLLEKKSGTPFVFHKIDEYLGATASLLNGKNQSFGCNSGFCDSRFHTIDADGYKRGCTALTTNEKLSFNPSTSSSNGVQVLSISDFREKRVESCQGCEFKAICRSGCITENLFDGSGGCSGGKSIYKKAKSLLERNIYF